MGPFYTDITIENPAQRGTRARISGVLVDTGAELSWVPAPVLESLGVAREKKTQRFTTADGRPLARSVGYAIVHAGGEQTVDEVVFGEPGDLTLLGARTLEGLNLRVDLVARRLVAARPMLAAAAA
jgi:predicted aspartyl protease